MPTKLESTNIRYCPPPCRYQIKFTKKIQKLHAGMLRHCLANSDTTGLAAQQLLIYIFQRSGIYFESLMT